MRRIGIIKLLFNVLDTVLNALIGLSNLILTGTLWGVYHFYSLFPDEEMAVQRGLINSIRPPNYEEAAARPQLTAVSF